jgi:hypothetical protein
MWLVTLAVTVVMAAPAASLTVAQRSELALPENSAASEAVRNLFADVGAPEGPAARRFEPHLLVHVSRPLDARARPERDARVVGTVVAGSKYYHVPLVAWVEKVARHGRWGRVELPYVWPRREGWIWLGGLRRETTAFEVRIDLSRHRITVFRRGESLFGFPTAIGAPVSPTPVGEYVVTDRIPFAHGGYLGSFAFGISGIQPHLPPGWNGGNQLAIHGTNSPSSIGRSVSAGCLRVSEAALARLRPILELGTPVMISR